MFDDMPPLFDVFAKITQRLLPDDELQGIADHVIARIKSTMGDHDLANIPPLLVIVSTDSKKKCLEVEAHDARADGMDDLLKHVIPDLARAAAKELKAKTPVAVFFVTEALIAYQNAAFKQLNLDEVTEKLEAEPDRYRNLSITGLTIDRRLLVYHVPLSMQEGRLCYDENKEYKATKIKRDQAVPVLNEFWQAFKAAAQKVVATNLGLSKQELECLNKTDKEEQETLPCPACKQEINGWSEVHDNGNNDLGPGDVGVCPECRTVLGVNDNQELIVLNADEIAKLDFIALGRAQPRIDERRHA